MKLFDGLFAYDDIPPPGCRFRFAEDKSFGFDSLDLPLNLELPGIPIEIRPFYTKYFTKPQTSGHFKLEESLIASFNAR